jgi:hypothetical protein
MGDHLLWERGDHGGQMLRQGEQGANADPQSLVRRPRTLTCADGGQVGDGAANGATTAIGQRDLDKGGPACGVQGNEFDLLSAQRVSGIDDRHMRHQPIKDGGVLWCSGSPP